MCIMLKRIIFFSVLVCLVLPVSVNADIIYLLDGRVYSGEIILENRTFIRFDTLVNDDGRVKEFLQHEIKSIEYGLMKPPQTINVHSSTKVKKDIKENPVEVIPPEAEIVNNVLPQESLPKPVSNLPIPSVEEPIKAEIQTIAQESRNQQEVISRKTSNMQPIQNEQIIDEIVKKNKTGWGVFKSRGFLFGFSVVPFLMCGFLGLFFARKFDSKEEDEEEVVETVVKPTPYDSPYPTQEVSQLVRRKKKQEKRGGLIPRVISRSIDIYLVIGVIMILYSLTSLIMMYDRFAVLLMMVIILPLIFLIFHYYFVGIGTLENTYGRYLLGVRVVDAHTGSMPSLGQAITRDFLLFCWPIDFFVLLFSKSKRRIGDNWAQTKVVVVPSQVSWIKRFFPGFIIGMFIYVFISVMSPHINDRMVTSQITRDLFGK